VKCAGSCGRDLGPREVAWSEVVGWIAHRGQGGANHVAAKHRTGRVMCAACFHAKRNGHHEQGRLI
jgi:hypothetical protein